MAESRGSKRKTESDPPPKRRGHPPSSETPTQNIPSSSSEGPPNYRSRVSGGRSDPRDILTPISNADYDDFVLPTPPRPTQLSTPPKLERRPYVGRVYAQQGSLSPPEDDVADFTQSTATKKFKLHRHRYLGEQGSSPADNPLHRDKHELGPPFPGYFGDLGPNAHLTPTMSYHRFSSSESDSSLRRQRVAHESAQALKNSVFEGAILIGEDGSLRKRDKFNGSHH